MNLLTLIAALIVVESHGRDNAIGDGGQAIGCLQMHPCVIEDVNRVYRTEFAFTDRTDHLKSIKIAQLYLWYWGNHYRTTTGKEPTWETYARIWNGGPYGYQKTATIRYWHKVKKVLDAEK